MPSDIIQQSMREVWYQRINWKRGPWSSSEAKQKVHKFWMDEGANGAAWLLNRLTREWNEDALDGVANLLINFKSIEPLIVNSLRSNDYDENQKNAVQKALINIRAAGC